MATARRTKKSQTDSKPGAPAAGTQDREILLVALNRLKPALRSGGAMPELGHMWFGDGYVRAYDGGLGIRLTLDLGAVCGVPGRPLLGLLGTSSLKEVSLSHDEKDVALIVKMGRSRTKLNVLDSGRDPWAFPDEHEGKSHISETGIEALRSALISKAAQATRLEHHGLCVYADGEDIDIYSTDGKTITQVTYKDKKAHLPEFTFLPRPLVEQIVALCPHGADLTCADDHFAAVGRDIAVCSNVLDTTDVADLPAIADKSLKDHADPVPLPAGLEAVLDRAEVLAGSGGDAVVAIDIDGNKFRLSGRYTFGELDEELELESSHPPVSFKAEAAILRRGLLVADDFSASAGSFAFWGGENFMHLVASRSD